MRKIMAGLGLCVALGSGAALRAQSPEPTAYEKDAGSPHMTAVQQRIYERAAFEARERIARIESRHRNGISIQRPAIYSGGVLVPSTLWTGPFHYYHSYPAPCPCP